MSKKKYIGRYIGYRKFKLSQISKSVSEPKISYRSTPTVYESIISCCQIFF